MSYPERLEIVPLSRPPLATIHLPGSKSVTNRALVLAALTAKGFAWELRGVLRSEDTELMIQALRGLGFRILTEWPESIVLVNSGAEEPLIPARGAELFAGNSGTSMRFLTALVSLGHGRFRLDGEPRMRQRPIQDLIDALGQLGVRAASEHGNGCPPVIVEADGLRGGRVRIKGDVSSQFLSGLLMVAPFARQDVTVEVKGRLVSWPYVYMTCQMMRHWGLRIDHPNDVLANSALLLAERRDWGERIQENAGLSFRIPANQYQAVVDQRDKASIWAVQEGLDPRRHLGLREYTIEPDASAASYFFGAAAITGGQVTIPGLTRQSLQGDIECAEVLADMGGQMSGDETALSFRGGPLSGIDVDMNAISDTVMTLAAVACFADGPTTIRNVAHIRHKETDRLHALATELGKLGARVHEQPDGLQIMPGPLHGAEIETYNDHRMAMSMALIGLRVPGVVIRNPGCVAKTYPRFWDDLERLRA
jgi:3-phosphoshikimate 1-carboxyvinyltransferase